MRGNSVYSFRYSLEVNEQNTYAHRILCVIRKVKYTWKFNTYGVSLLTQVIVTYRNSINSVTKFKYHIIVIVIITITITIPVNLSSYAYNDHFLFGTSCISSVCIETLKRHAVVFSS
jgi:hypothetical protein